MKLNWFSPLPPAKSGVAADFFRTIFPALTEHAEVTLWTDQSHWAPWLETRAQVRKFSLDRMPWVELNRADLSFFNLGNDHTFHGSIWEVSRLLPGVTILHDSDLKEFFDSWLRLRPLSEEHPLDLDVTFALANSLGIVVHTREAYDQITAANRWIVAHIPLAFSLPPSARTKRSRESVRPPYRLIVFGFINRNRRLPALLEALAMLPHKEKFRLEIYGELWDAALVREQVTRLGLRDQVQIKGFVSEEALDDALASADLAVNLRYPSLGEASGSQLRIWSHELPSIVTRAGWFATLPDTVVAHVDPEREVADIQNHLSNFLADPEAFKSMGVEGKRLLYPTHAPETYVRALLDFAAQVIKFRPRAAAHYLARRAGQAMSPWINAVGSDDPLKRAAEEMLKITRSDPGGL